MSVTSHLTSRSLVQVRPLVYANVAQLVRAGAPQGAFHLLLFTLFLKT